MKTIAITGALGHIGSKLIHGLKLRQFKEVRLIDNLLTQRYCSLFNLPKGINFNFFEANICEVDLNEYFKGVDIVVHLAAITDAESSFNKAKLVEKVNFLGTKRVAEACIRQRCKLFFPSTTSVYGVQKGLVAENCSENDLKPQSPYAQSKLKAERILLKLGKKKGLKFVICRFGTIFGPSVGMRFHTAVNKFIWQACIGQPITVWQTAMYQKRPYLDLKDATRAIFFIIKKDLFDQEIYNIITLNSTVSKIIKMIKKFIPNLKIDYVKNQIMNQLTYTVSNKKFKKYGFRFTGSIEKSIEETIKLLNSISL